MSDAAALAGEDWHRGHWMQTYTGRAFYPLRPRVEDIDGHDIGHSLALQCRYNGHVRRFYSVAWLYGSGFPKSTVPVRSSRSARTRCQRTSRGTGSAPALRHMQTLLPRRRDV